MAFTLKHHDHAYVKRRGDWPLLTHLRAGSSRAEFRRAAIQRAFFLFEAAEAERLPEPEIGGRGLVVLQRALLAAEDLAGLLHAFAGEDPWRRLRLARIDDLDAAFVRAVSEPDSVLRETFRLTSSDELKEMTLSADEYRALGRLRDRVARRWAQMLAGAAELWLNYRGVAKSTMHGFPLLAGTHVVGPPGAGELGRGVHPRGRFALAVSSRLTDKHMTTDRQVIPLDRDSVDGYRRNGRMVARLAGELCEAQAETIMSGHAVAVPLRLLAPPRADEPVLRGIVARQEQNDGLAT